MQYFPRYFLNLFKLETSVIISAKLGFYLKCLLEYFCSQFCITIKEIFSLPPLLLDFFPFYFNFSVFINLNTKFFNTSKLSPSVPFVKEPNYKLGISRNSLTGISGTLQFHLIVFFF